MPLWLATGNKKRGGWRKHPGLTFRVIPMLLPLAPMTSLSMAIVTTGFPVGIEFGPVSQAQGVSSGSLQSSGLVALTGSSLQPGLSVGATTGKGAGVGIAVVVVIGFVVVLCRRKGRILRKTTEGWPCSNITPESHEPKDAAQGRAVVEVPCTAVCRQQSEMHELPWR